MNRVEPEPGNGAYDLKVTNGGNKEFVEVKTRTASGFTEKWVGEKIEDINDKYSSAQEADVIGITEDNSVLELRARGEATSKSSAKEAVRDAASEADEVNANEIRVVFENGDVVSVKSW
ncbi:hypothetical protein [Haloarcula argentinensis]|uniref:Uncharacterized protein n=1 Tax=Haloarcula argentinensis TaxID=43776 RepID=A0ABU2F5Q2_HALAR|nr:hypothetical protein [Haloarcula argentinensis]EMA26716.1 putative calcium-binding protein [Haloarcula argentinensis DSM 12282]MDS0255807.1 hypothetical protein [Haloarcula argentinensis]